MLKYDFLRRIARFLTKNEQHLWSTIIKSIPLWILMTSVSCQCGNPDDAIFSFKKESTLCLKVDNPTLKGDEQTFCLTIENTSNKAIDLFDYELKTNIQESSITSSTICYQNKRGYIQHLPINQMIRARFTQLTNQSDLKLNPGESLSLPSFTINPAIDVQDLTIHFELIGHFDKNPTAIATVTWQKVIYQLEFQDLQNWIGNEQIYFKVHNTGNEAINTNNITVVLESNNQAKFTLGNQTGQSLELSLASILGHNLTSLEQQAITPAISLRVSDAHDKQSAMVTLRLLNKSQRELAHQSVMWYSTVISLEGPDNFSDDNIQLSLKPQATKLDIGQVKVYLTSTNGVSVTLNGQQVDSNGIGLANIIQGDNNLDIDNTQTINLAIDSNPNQAESTTITLELSDEKNQVLARKKINWFNPNSETNITDQLIQDLQRTDTFLASVLKLLREGNSLEAVNKRTFVVRILDSQTLLNRVIDLSKVELANKVKLINILLHKGDNVNAKGKENDTPLHVAVKGNQITIVKILLAAKATVTAKNQDEDKPLHIAAEKDNPEIVSLLLEQETSATVADKGYLQRTPLHWAAIRNNQEVAKALIQKGGTHLIDQQDQDGKTALHLAVFGRNLEMVDILLAEGANKNMEDSYGKKPIDYAKDPIIKAMLLKSLGNY